MIEGAVGDRKESRINRRLPTSCSHCTWNAGRPSTAPSSDLNLCFMVLMAAVCTKNRSLEAQAAARKHINDVYIVRRKEKRTKKETTKKMRERKEKGKRECTVYRRVNRPSRRCLIRYLGAAKSLLIYPSYKRCLCRRNNVGPRRERKRKEREVSPNGTSPKAGLIRNKSQRFINLTSLMWCLWHFRSTTSSSTGMSTIPLQSVWSSPQRINILINILIRVIN